jgi:transcriptional regulator with XRE-family HTH domain
MTNAQEQKLMKAFGKRVAEVRKSRGVTQQELAENIGMSVVAIAYIETGKRWARLGTLNKIANQRSNTQVPSILRSWLAGRFHYPLPQEQLLLRHALSSLKKV